MLANSAAASMPALRVATPAVLLLVFAAYVTIGLKRFTFAGAIDGIDPVLVGATAAGREPMREQKRYRAPERGQCRCRCRGPRPRGGLRLPLRGHRKRVLPHPARGRVFAMLAGAATAPTSRRRRSSCPQTP